MNKKLPLMGIIVLMAAIAASCSKNYNSGSVTAASQNELFAALRTTPQNISVTAGRDTIVFGASGTMLHFYYNSFKDASGNILTSGTINISLIEMQKPGDFIANRTSCTANGQLLQSTGQIYVNPTMNGNTVYMNKYGAGFKQSAPSATVMDLFYGNGNNPDSVIKWAISDTTNKGSVANGTSQTDTVVSGGGTGSGTGTTIVFISDSLMVYDTCINAGWVNSDRIYWPPNTYTNTTVHVVLPNSTFTDFNTEIYLVLVPINCVLIIRGDYDAATNTVSLDDDGTTVPIGMNYKIAVISKQGDNYYYYQGSGVTSSGMTINAALSSATLSQVKDGLGSL